MRFRLINIPNTKGARKNRLIRKISKRLDREIPKRKWGKILSALFGIGIIFIGTAMDGGRASEFVAAALPFVLFAIEYLRLKERAPRPKWREIMLISGCGALIFAFFPFAMWMDKESGARIEPFIYLYGGLSLLMLCLFGFAVWRYRNIRRETAEEIDLMRQRAIRRKKLSQL